MSAQNIHWPTYLAIEQEVLDLAYNINFDDKQIRVYSLRMADLIIKISSELESVANDIYRKYAQKEPSKASESFKWLEETWRICKKHVSLISPYLYFIKQFSPSFAPFLYGSKSQNNYYKAYCALKHDKLKNLEKANINILIRCFASLYLLNLYWGGNERLENNKSRVFEATKAGLGIGLFIDYGFNLNSFLQKCTAIDLYSTLYYFHRENHQQEIRGLVNALSGEQKGQFKTEIFAHQNNPYYLIGILISFAKPGIKAGELLTMQRELLDGLADTTYVKTSLNFDYTKVYIPKNDMGKTYAQIDSRTICDRIEFEESALFENGVFA